VLENPSVITSNWLRQMTGFLEKKTIGMDKANFVSYDSLTSRLGNKAKSQLLFVTKLPNNVCVVW
jgi:hypothetical protein